jgi:uncharacterized membrane protein
MVPFVLVIVTSRTTFGSVGFVPIASKDASPKKLSHWALVVAIAMCFFAAAVAIRVTRFPPPANGVYATLMAWLGVTLIVLFYVRE